MTRIGLYFGSFNPIHIGHIAIAGYMIEFTNLEQVWFVVSPHNPLKAKGSLLADHHRLYMAELAIGNHEQMRASDIEFKLKVPSYTIDTLTYLNEKYPKYEFSLIMGEDNLYTLHKWKNVQEVVKRYPIFVYPRPESAKPVTPMLDQVLSLAEIHSVKAPLMDISGTFIRDGIRKGKDMSYYLEPSVWKYIKDMHFYEK